MNRFAVWKTIGIWLLLCGLIRAIPVAAQEAGQPPTTPILRIETGRHTAVIKQIGMDAAQKYLVSASDDKTARVWDRATGKLLQTLRPPIGAGDEGELSTVAISPDGQTVACAGWTGVAWCIYLFDRASGRIVRRITGLPNIIDRLAFSPNGEYLVATLKGKNGLRVFRTGNGKPVAEGEDYGNFSYGADFDRDGRFITTCLDGFVRLYSADFTLKQKVAAPDGKQPYRVRFSPDGKRIAVGYADAAKVSVLSGEDLTTLYRPGVAGINNGPLACVCWSADGSRLYASGMYQKGGFTQIRVWRDGGRGVATDWPAAQNTLSDLLPLRTGGVAFASAEPTLGLLDGNGRPLWKQIAPTADYRGCLEHFLLSGDGATVQFGFAGYGKQPARYDAAAHRLNSYLPDAAQGSLHSPRITAPDLNITDWFNTTAPKRNGEPLPLKQYEISRCLAIAPDAQHFLLGTEWFVYCFDRDGKEAGKVPASGVVCSVNIAANGNIGVAAFGDGTIHWYRMSDGKELLAFFPHADKKRWVAWTPSGYYDCSPGGEDLIGWHINNGKDAAADFYPGSRFHDSLYRPDVIERVLSALDEKEAVRLADEAAGRKTQVVDIAKSLPPVVRIVSPADGATVRENKVTIRYALRTPSGEKITGLRVLIDGRPADEGNRDFQVVPKTQTDEAMNETTVTVAARDCEVSLIAENRFAASVPAVVRLKWSGASETDALKPTLYVLAIGASKYAEDGLSLNYAAKDAADFAAAMQAQKGLLYREVVVKLIQDTDVNRANVVNGLVWIRKQTGSRDVAMVFVSGHGANDVTGDYYFVPSDCRRDSLESMGVAMSEFTRTFQHIAGKALLFLDTCHAGNVVGGGRTKGDKVDTTAIVNELSRAENGAIVFASATRSELAQENDDWRNGAFTKALIEGLAGKADAQHTGRITTLMLSLYVSERVKELTKGGQHPVTTPIDAGSSTCDFPLAFVK